MLIRRFDDCEEITANDGCRLRELLHPERQDAAVRFSRAVARVEPGGATHPHRLTAETEVYLILEGTGRMHIDDETSELHEGDLVVIPRGSRQWIEALGERPLRFVAVVDPPWVAEHDVRER